MKTQTANQLSGRAVGALFFSGFGAIWVGLALYAMEWLSVATVSGLLLGLAALILAALLLFRAAKRFPRVPEDPAVGRAFAWINAIQWIAVILVVVACARLHFDAYVMCAIAAIVGLHLFPLARLFRNALNYATGAALVAWAAGSALLVPIEHLQGISALGTGIILWLSAAVTLTLALREARQSPEPLTC
jgi:hypothetical protein